MIERFRQLRTLKNAIQAALVNEGVVLSSRGKRQLLEGPRCGDPAVRVEVSAASSPIVCAHLQVLEKLRETKAELQGRVSREACARQRAAGRPDQAADEQPRDYRPHCGDVLGRRRRCAAFQEPAQDVDVRQQSVPMNRPSRPWRPGVPLRTACATMGPGRRPHGQLSHDTSSV